MSREQNNHCAPEGTVQPNHALRKALIIALIYFVIGCLWIILSDTVVEQLFPEHIGLFRISVVKGLFYVMVTTVIIFHMIYAAFRNLTKSQVKMRESEALFRTIFEQAPIGIAVGCNDKYAELEGYLPGINPMFEKITGRTKEQWANFRWTESTHPGDLKADREPLKKFEGGEIGNFDVERRFIRPDGSEAWLHIVVAPLKVGEGGKYNHIQLVEDITTRKQMELQLWESERSKGVLLGNLPGIAYRCDFDKAWTMQFISEGCYELTGYRSESLIGNRVKSYKDLIAPEYWEPVWNKWVEVVKSREKFKGEYQIITAAGDLKWVFEQGQGVFDGDGRVTALEGLIIDITEQKKQEHELRFISEHDTLTGLYNRRYFEEVLERDTEASENQNRAVVLLNLNRINSVSLSFGYNFAEKTVRELAEALAPLANESRELFRVSFERFAFYIKGYQDADELSEFCEGIIRVLSKRKILHSIGCGIGILEIDPHCCEVDGILKNASIAAERAVRNTPFGYRVFDEKLKVQVVRETVIKDELMQAASVENDGRIYLQYQPILDLRTNKIHAFEALARFRSEKLGIVNPVEFIPIAEEMQLIGSIGQTVLRMAGAFSRRLESIGSEDLLISVNVSPLQLILDDFLEDLLRIMEETALPARNLGLEITESVFSENYDLINEKLSKIKGLGIRIAIDDFGSGYSSLARERELNVNCLKIDKFFIDKLLSLNPEEALTSDIISMAHKLGHLVVAEGAEHEIQKQYLIEHDCDLMQGFLFSRPLDPDAAIALLQKMNQAFL